MGRRDKENEIIKVQRKIFVGGKGLQDTRRRGLWPRG
jgi:hypothetical protein